MRPTPGQVRSAEYESCSSFAVLGFSSGRVLCPGAGCSLAPSREKCDARDSPKCDLRVRVGVDPNFGGGNFRAKAEAQRRAAERIARIAGPGQRWAVAFTAEL